MTHLSHIYVTYTPYLDAYHALGAGERLFTVSYVNNAWRTLRSVKRLDGWPIVKASERNWLTRHAAMTELLAELGYSVERLLDDGTRWDLVPLTSVSNAMTTSGRVEDTAGSSASSVRSSIAPVASSSGPKRFIKKKKKLVLPSHDSAVDLMNYIAEGK